MKKNNKTNDAMYLEVNEETNVANYENDDANIEYNKSEINYGRVKLLANNYNYDKLNDKSILKKYIRNTLTKNDFENDNVYNSIDYGTFVEVSFDEANINDGTKTIGDSVKEHFKDNENVAQAVVNNVLINESINDNTDATLLNTNVVANNNNVDSLEKNEK